MKPHPLALPALLLMLGDVACTEDLGEDMGGAGTQSGGDSSGGDSSGGAEDVPCVEELIAYPLPWRSHNWRVEDVIARGDAWTVLLAYVGEGELEMISIDAKGLEVIGTREVPATTESGALVIDADGRDCAVYVAGGDLQYWCAGRAVEAAGLTDVDLDWPPHPVSLGDGSLRVSVVDGGEHTVLERSTTGVWSEVARDVGTESHATSVDRGGDAMCVLVDGLPRVRGDFGEIRLSPWAEYCHVAVDAESGAIGVLTMRFDPPSSFYGLLDPVDGAVTLEAAELPGGSPRLGVVASGGSAYAITREEDRVLARPLPSGEAIVLLEDDRLASAVVVSDQRRIVIASRIEVKADEDHVQIATVCKESL